MSDTVKWHGTTILSLPMGLIAAFWPDVAGGISKGMNGYLGYTAARQRGKVKGAER